LSYHDLSHFGEILCADNTHFHPRMVVYENAKFCNFKWQTAVTLIKNLPAVNVHKINTVYTHVNGDMEKNDISKRDRIMNCDIT